MNTPQTSYDEILEQLQNKSRRPFEALLARILACAPSDEALRALAERSPDRWGQLTSVVSKPAGYNDKLEIEGSVVHKISDMSDLQLQEEIAKSQLHMQTSEPEYRTSEQISHETRLLGS